MFKYVGFMFLASIVFAFIIQVYLMIANTGLFW